jgi:hypothetical protein
MGVFVSLFGDIKDIQKNEIITQKWNNDNNLDGWF